MKHFYRVCNIETKQGLWYNINGVFTGLIHNKFNFCTNNKLLMDFDSELTGYLSATPTLDELYLWFPKEDIIQLQKYNYYIHVFESNDFKFYNKFKHYIINQNNAKCVKIIKL